MKNGNVRSLEDKRAERKADASCARLKSKAFHRRLATEPELGERIALRLIGEKLEAHSFWLSKLGPVLQELLALGVTAQAMNVIKGGDIDWRLAVQKMIPSFDLNEIIARAEQIAANFPAEYERLNAMGMLKPDEK